MAYISYGSHSPARQTATKTPRRSTVAWERIIVMAASLAIWVGLIASIRAIF